MIERPDALIVNGALWTAIAAGGYLGCVLARAGRAGSALVAAVLGVGASLGGVAEAGSPHPRPSERPSLDWHAYGDHATRGSAVVVRPGDCLWAITARELRDPTAARVSAHWPGWWRANRRVIGSDPNLIHPGQRLRRPGPTPRRH